MPANGCSTNETNCFPFPHNRRNGKRPSISPSTFRKVRRRRQALSALFKIHQRECVPLDEFSNANSHNRSFFAGVGPTPTRRGATCRQLSPSRPSKTAHSPSRHSRHAFERASWRVDSIRNGVAHFPRDIVTAIGIRVVVHRRLVGFVVDIHPVDLMHERTHSPIGVSVGHRGPGKRPIHLYSLKRNRRNRWR